MLQKSRSALENLEKAAAPAARVPGSRPDNSGLLKSAATLEQIFVKELIPHIDSYYRIKPGRKNRAMAGLSLGGFQTFMIGISHTEFFSSYSFFSAAIIGNFMSDPKSMTAAIEWAVAPNSQIESPLFD